MRFLPLFFVFLIFAADPAAACNYQHQPFETSFEQAQTAFIGTVATVENGAVYFRVEKPLKNIEQDAQFSAESGRSGCDLRTAPGQVWLYLGPAYPDGSLMIRDQYGRANPENAALAREKFGYDYTQSPSIRSGTMKRSCAPWDGSAVEIVLDNNVRASAYVSLSSFKDKNQIVSFSTDNTQSGGAAILLCDKDGGSCQPKTGTLAISYDGGETASGRIDIKDDEEHTTSYVFRVKFVNEQVFCG